MWPCGHVPNDPIPLNESNYLTTFTLSPPATLLISSPTSLMDPRYLDLHFDILTANTLVYLHNQIRHSRIICPYQTTCTLMCQRFVHKSCQHINKSPRLHIPLATPSYLPLPYLPAALSQATSPESVQIYTRIPSSLLNSWRYAKDPPSPI